MTSLRLARRREAGRVSTYFLDESGNTGDVSKTGPTFEFDRQPLFVLACVGIEDVADMAREMDRLRVTHRIKASEVKATNLAAKPLFVIDLLSYLRKHELPLFMEIVDKRFFICMHIVEGLLLTSVDAEFDFSPQSRFMKQTFAERLATTAPNDVLQAYIAACESPGVDSMRAAFRSLRGWLEARPEDEVATGMLRFLVDEQEEFEAAEWGEVHAVKRTLPLPDDSLRGRPVWMLPNLTSFTNIYARLNRYHFRKIGRLTLIHDEQRYFEHIMRAGKISAEGLSKQNVRVQLPDADFRFRESATLRFAPSDTTPGVQLADVIAGFTMRYLRDRLSGVRPTPEQGRAFWELMQAADPREGRGINYVMTFRDLRRLGIPTV